MNILKVIALVLLPLYVSAGTGLYVEVGASYHDDRMSRPEVNLQTPLGSIEIGYQNKDDWSIGARHTSSIPGREIGEGINELFITKRIWIK